jgi:hypothetical protein
MIEATRGDDEAMAEWPRAEGVTHELLLFLLPPGRPLQLSVRPPGPRPYIRGIPTLSTYLHVGSYM